MKLHYSNFKLSGGGEIDTQRSFYYESGRYVTIFIRIIRVYYVQGGRPGIQALSYKTFAPAQLSMGSMFSAPYFEGLSQCMQRAMAWLKLTSMYRC